MKMVEKSMARKKPKTIWGPVLKAGVSPIGPKPPVRRPNDDDYKWGAGEEADFISFSPIFEPSQNDWATTQDIWNLPPESFDGDSIRRIPRRASLGTMARLSKPLLDEMHSAQLEGWGLASELLPSTLALWHGLKAVHVPHPIYGDSKWPSKEIAQLLGPDSSTQITGRPSGVRNWNQRLDRILFRLSFVFTIPTADDLFRQWMGQKLEPDRKSKNKLVSLPEPLEMYD